MNRLAIVVIGSALQIGPPALAEAPKPPSDTSSPAPAEAPSSAPAAPVPSEATKELVDKAEPGVAAPKDGVDPAILRAEVMLDRVHASPGVIDGRDGKNFTKALAMFAKARRIKGAHGLDRTLWSALVAESPGPVLTDYVLSDADVAGPFVPDIPKDYAAQARLPALAYRSPSQKIAAKFHMSERLLAALNPGVELKAGTRILVADVAAPAVRGRLQSIVVDKRKGEVIALDRQGRILAAYPATIGSRALPSPSGTYRVKGVAWNPVYYYDPEKNFVQGDNHDKLRLPPGPNNPVGSVFIALTKPTYGLHGTPDPDKIDKTASHGCVRMTNWDASELAHLVKPRIVVRFRG